MNLKFSLIPKPKTSRTRQILVWALMILFWVLFYFFMEHSEKPGATDQPKDALSSELPSPKQMETPSASPKN